MNEVPIRWVEAGRVEDIPVRGARRVIDGATTIALFRTTNGGVHALEDRCPHRGGPLSQGIVHGDCVTCPLHNWVIGLEDGQARGADEGSVTRYPVRVDNDVVMLALDPVRVADRGLAETTVAQDSQGDAEMMRHDDAAAA